ncbi:hypothetical protein K458DRAFT_10128 [Lentithecium fluviatile CBS 122367]|uniref:Uncharacterized protein n=1 Tax=Lentithecium fluviatile CBS 122367 TaxID=1168545 RepID=A0A6G1JNH0_9PLEO|nr:hypothetical protein K458DRAFT_10128 [Lentithecium fluviatile CBS 122367]
MEAETNYIAKDIALFCHVLKDLAKALEFGQKAQLFRQNAFDTSLKIVEECKRVFTEIEDILKKATKSDNPLAGKFRMPTGHKILWIFRKGKVDFFRRLLESLKSTILVELAVLNYAIKVTSHLSKDTVDVDELLALKSLVLANETAKQEFQHQAESSGETLDNDDISANGASPRSVPSNPLLIATSTAGNGLATENASHSHPRRSSEGVRLAPTSDLIVASGSLPYWSQIDRLELAAQKLELAKWEYCRLEENIALGKPKGSIDSEMRQDFLMDRIKNGLTKFGMREELIAAAMSILQSKHDGPTPERTPVYPIISQDSEQLSGLRSSGLVATSDGESSKESVVLRWLPDLFVDVLYEHTQDLLEKSGVPRQLVTKAPKGQISEPPGNETSEQRYPLDSGTQQSPHGTTRATKEGHAPQMTWIVPAHLGNE